MRIPMNINKLPETALFFCSGDKIRMSTFFNFNFPTSPRFYNSLYFNINLTDLLGEVMGEVWGKYGEVKGKLLCFGCKLPLAVSDWIIAEIQWLGEVGKLGEGVFALLKTERVLFSSLSGLVLSVKGLLFRLLRCVVVRLNTVYSCKAQKAFCFWSLLAGCSYVGRVRRKERNQSMAQNFIKCCNGIRTMEDINELRGQDIMKSAMRNEIDCVLSWIGKAGQAPPHERFLKSGGNPHLLLAINWSTLLKDFSKVCFKTCVVFRSFRQSVLAAAGFPKVGGRGE